MGHVRDKGEKGLLGDVIGILLMREGLGELLLSPQSSHQLCMRLLSSTLLVRTIR